MMTHFAKLLVPPASPPFTGPFIQLNWVDVAESK